MVRSLKICRHTSSTINIFAPVKQHFKHFEGKEYLSHMENKPQGEWKTPSYIFIAENACGIIRLLMTGKDVPQIKATAGVWWKAFAAPKSGTLTLRNDVSQQQAFTTTQTHESTGLQNPHAGVRWVFYPRAQVLANSPSFRLRSVLRVADLSGFTASTDAGRRLQSAYHDRHLGLLQPDTIELLRSHAGWRSASLFVRS